LANEKKPFPAKTSDKFRAVRALSVEARVFLPSRRAPDAADTGINSSDR